MSLEFQRYGRNKDTLINNTYIDSGEYRNKFNGITIIKTSTESSIQRQKKCSGTGAVQ